MTTQISYISIALLALAGFSLAYYIWSKKRTDVTSLVCPLKGNCAEVVGSKYAHVFGISVEFLGMTYYGFSAVSYFAFASIATHVPGSIMTLFNILALGAFLFSVYLTSVQTFIIKHFCTWCIISAVISTAIFVITLS